MHEFSICIERICQSVDVDMAVGVQISIFREKYKDPILLEFLLRQGQRIEQTNFHQSQFFFDSFNHVHTNRRPTKLKRFQQCSTFFLPFLIDFSPSRKYSTECRHHCKTRIIYMEISSFESRVFLLLLRYSDKISFLAFPSSSAWD